MPNSPFNKRIDFTFLIKKKILIIIPIFPYFLILKIKNGRILLSSLTLALSHQATAEDESGQIEKVAPLFLLLLCGVNKALKNLLLLLLTVSRKEETLCRGFALAPPKGGGLGRRRSKKFCNCPESRFS